MIVVDHGWYAERQRTMLAIYAEAIGQIANLMDEHPTGFAPQIHAELRAILLSAYVADQHHHAATPSDFGRCPACGHALEAIP